MSGELFVKVTVWLALIAYVPVLASALIGRRAGRWQAAARLLSTIGLLAFWAHVVAAFGVYYAWSHGIALRETARATEAVTGRASGTGLWLNYLFTIAWTVDVVWWWRVGLPRYRARSRWLAAAWHGFFLFMAINATVVFEEGPVRWIAAAFAVLLGFLALAVARRARRQRVGIAGAVGRSERTSALSVGKQ